MVARRGKKNDLAGQLLSQSPTSFLGMRGCQDSPLLSVSTGSVEPNNKQRQIEMVPLKGLKKSPNNARTHPKRQIEQLAHLLRSLGFINPIVVDKHNRIIAGHARAAAAKLIGLTTVPVLRLADLNETQLRAYMLADNRVAEGAGWNKELLAVEIGELQVALPEIGLSLSVIGFEPDEVDSLSEDFAEASDHPEDEIPEVPKTAIARPGDLFHLGNHRVFVGDARDGSAYKHLMGSQIADMAFLDPPYNVKIMGHVGGRGRTKHREFAHGSGEMTSSQFTGFLKDSLSAVMQHVKDGTIIYCCIDWRHCSELLAAGAGLVELKNICVWAKTNAGQGTFYRSAHEFVFVYKWGTAPHINNFGLGQNGRRRSNLWTYAGINSFRAGRMDELKMHPTVKPVAMIADAMKDCSRRGSVVLDSFCGSGSTIMAAEQVGRRAYCMEIDPLYADVAIRRWQRVTRKDAVLHSTGQTFDELAHTRRSSTKQVIG